MRVIEEFDAQQITEEVFTCEHPSPLHIKGIVYDSKLRVAYPFNQAHPTIVGIGDWIICDKYGNAKTCTNSEFNSRYTVIQ